MSVCNNTRFASKAGIYCILVLLLCPVIGSGIASADNSNASAAVSDTAPVSIKGGIAPEDQEFIYISGSNVDAVLNYNPSGSFRVDDGFKTTKGAADIAYSRNGNMYSFNISGFNLFSLRISETTRNLTFSAYSSGSTTPVFYPIYSDDTANNPSYYYHYAVSILTSFDEGLFEKMADHDLVYRFSDNNLRSVYWFDGFRSVTNDYDKKFMPMKMVYSVNMSDLQDIGISSLFICPSHDPNNNKNGNGNPTGGAGKGSCVKDLEWVVSVNGELRDASDYLNINSQGKKANHFQHIVTFTDLSLLHNDLMSSQEVEFMFYPKGYEETAVLFVFEREGAHVSISNYLEDVDEDGKFHVPIPSGSSFGNPALSSMTFPAGTSSLLSTATVLISDLDYSFFESFGSEDVFEDLDIVVHLFVDIDFGESKESLNQYLSESGQTVSLTFLVPKSVGGTDVVIDELKIFHITKIDGQPTFEELSNLTVVNSENEEYYLATAEATGFSPFAVLSVSDSEDGSGSVTPGPDPVLNPDSKLADPSPSSSISLSSGTHQVSVIPEKISEATGFVPNLSSITPEIPAVIETLQGHLSLFSILVVFVSGMFMWNYIRRRL